LPDHINVRKALQQEGQFRAGFSSSTMMVFMDMYAEYRRTLLQQANRRGPAATWRISFFPVSWAAQMGARTTKMRKSSSTPRARNAIVLSSTTIYEGPVFGIRRDEVIEPSGVRATREVITHPGSVVVLPVLPDGRILLIEQYRHATKQYLWELVAGRIDGGETPKVAAARELIEETGYRAKRFRVFLDVFPTPGFLEERMFILLAEGLTAGEAEPEEDEKIVSRAYNRKELEEMIRGGKLRDAKSIAGILYYLRFLAPAKR
jgi:ADP-ribose pyrophosphatase